MNLTSGKVSKALKILVYGPEGIGKSTFASQFPNPIFIDTEGSTDHMDVTRAKPASWTELLMMVDEVTNTQICSTLVIDTADWAERFCMEHICASYQIKSIEGLGYGKGYTILAEEFGKLLDKLSRLVERGTNVVLTAHSIIRTITLPDEMGTYDRWELKLQKKTSPLLKEWSDLMLFANYKTFIVKDDNGKGKAQGGKRVMYTTHNTTYDAKNRFGLPDELPFEYAAIASIIPSGITPAPDPVSTPAPAQEAAPAPDPAPKKEKKKKSEPPVMQKTVEEVKADPALIDALAKLQKLMEADGATEEDVRKAVAHFQYFPEDTAIIDYGAEFISGMLVAYWPEVKKTIDQIKDMPF